MLATDEVSRLYELDRTHWLHPQGDLGSPPGTMPQLMFSHGEGAVLTDVEGRDYVDAMSSLWNVNVGYGRRQLGEVAAEQMSQLAFSSGYGGFGTRLLQSALMAMEPAIVEVPEPTGEDGAEIADEVA